MSSPYTDPKDFAMHLSGEFLSDFLKKQFGIDFTVIKKEKAEDMADRFFETVKTHPQKDQIYVDLEYINSVSSPRHVDALLTRAMYLTHVVDQDSYARCKNDDERALWWFMNHRDVFDQYVEINDLEDISGAHEIVIPAKYIKTIEEIVAAGFGRLEQQVSVIYAKSLRGDKCKIKQVSLSNDKTLIVRAYLEDRPTGELAFDGNEITRNKPHRPVFSIVYIYYPEQRILGVKAMGGQENITALQETFCQLFLGCRLEDTEIRAFDLTQITDVANMQMLPEPSDDIEYVYLKAIELRHASGLSHRLRIDVGRRYREKGTDAMQTLLHEIGLKNLSQWEPTKIEIKFVFKNLLGKGRRPQITVRITPKGCNLKQRKEDVVIRRLLQRWGFAK